MSSSSRATRPSKVICGWGLRWAAHPISAARTGSRPQSTLPPPPAEKHYALAQQFYTKALDVDPTNPQLWGNRAFAAIRLEARGCCLHS